MKIFVYSDIHGSVSALEEVQKAAVREAPDKIVCCGDLFGGWSSNERIAELAQGFDVPLYFVRGNNDRFGCDRFLTCGMEDGIPMYHFGRTLFFTHGDVYNGWRIPPVLSEGDAIVFGHTHMGSLLKRDGIFALNVGSAAIPRDGMPSYLVLDEQGAVLRRLDGTDIYFLPWQE